MIKLRGKYTYLDHSHLKSGNVIGQQQGSETHRSLLKVQNLHELAILPYNFNKPNSFLLKL